MVWFGIMMTFQTVLPYVNGLFRIDNAISIARMIDLGPNFRRLSWHAYSFRHHVYARCCHQFSSIKDSISSPSCLHAQWRIDVGSSTVNWILSRLFLNNMGMVLCEYRLCFFKPLPRCARLTSPLCWRTLCLWAQRLCSSSSAVIIFAWFLAVAA